MYDYVNPYETKDHTRNVVDFTAKQLVSQKQYHTLQSDAQKQMLRLKKEQE